MHIYIKLSGVCRNTMLLLHLISVVFIHFAEKLALFCKRSRVCTFFWYMKRGLSLQCFQLSMDLSACTSTWSFSYWRIKKAFYLFDYTMNCIKLLLRQSHPRKGFGFAWPAQYFNGSIAGDNRHYWNRRNLLDFPLVFSFVHWLSVCCAFCI